MLQPDACGESGINALEPSYRAGLFSAPVCASGRYSLPGRWPTETGMRGWACRTLKWDTPTTWGPMLRADPRPSEKYPENQESHSGESETIAGLRTCERPTAWLGMW